MPPKRRSHHAASSHRGHEEMHSRGAARAPMHGHGEPGSPDRRQAEREHHQRTLWAPLSVVILGAWLASGPVTFGYGGSLARSDLIRRLLLVVLGTAWTATPRWASIPVMLVMIPLRRWRPGQGSRRHPQHGRD